MEKDAIRGAVDALIRTNRLHRTVIEKEMSQFGFHRNSHRLLRYLAREGGVPSQKQLAEQFHITPAAVTGMLQRLERDGYIKRTLGTDNRFNKITVTAKGREAVDRSGELFERIDRRLFNGFSEEELAGLTAYLTRMRVNLESQEGENNETLV